MSWNAEAVKRRQSRELHSMTRAGERVLIVRPPPPPPPEEEPLPPVTLGGEGAGSKRPWKQECLYKRGAGRLHGVATQKSWVTITTLAPLPPQECCEECCSLPERCKMPEFSCGFFIRFRPCDDNTNNKDSREQLVFSGRDTQG